MNKTKYHPGDIVELGGIEFVVLDNNYRDQGDLFILTLNVQGRSRFGRNNNYSESELRVKIEKWWENFLEYANTEILARYRTLDLCTLDGRSDYGYFGTLVAPLSLEEIREYATVIPPCDNSYWLTTGWDGSEYGASSILVVNPDGELSNNSCFEYSAGIRLALVIDPASLNEIKKPDLSKYSTDVLLAEIRSRTKTEI